METPRFTYNPTADSESEPSFSGILEIHVHHARNIHNICIYDDQDVYAKFSLTYNPDDTFSTRIIDRGGKSPEFDEELVMSITQMDAVLKCEIWMLSRAKNFMDDQLLGFTLVPISSVLGKGKVTKDFNLSSTDLFHSPAGTIKLSLSLSANTPLNPFSPTFSDSAADSSVTSELLVDQKISDEYSRVEFPDIHVVSENQQMVSQYFDLTKNGALLKPWLEKPDGSFLHLGAAPLATVDDYEMAGNSSEGYHSDSTSPNQSVRNVSFFNSTMTSLGKDQYTADSVHDTASKKVEQEPNLTCKEEEISEEGNKSAVNLARNVKLEVDESAMQQQIVDMYMRSMHQFTESLAKMKLPMDLDKPQAQAQAQAANHGDSTGSLNEKNNKKESSRVFYGSRAFF